ncbi:MAG: RecX family transcriptional regulator [Aerococcus sp.]|nr:RecX family transcriptional regulator [Aerococcus sp.]
MPEYQRPQKLSEIADGKKSKKIKAATRGDDFSAREDYSLLTRHKQGKKVTSSVGGIGRPSTTRRQYKKKQRWQESNKKRMDDLENEAKDEKTPIAGTITMVEAQKRHKDRYNIYVDGVFAFGVSENTLAHFALFKNQVLTPERTRLIQRYEVENKLFERALHYLSHSLRTKKQVIDRLKKETDQEALITSTLERLESLGFIDDRTFAKSYTRTAMRVQNKGPQKIKQELKQKGISDEDMAIGLAEYDTVILNDNSRQLAEKKYATYKRRYSHTESLQKTRQFLYQKGYSNEEIQTALAVLSEHEVDEEKEWELLVTTRDKYWQRYRKYDNQKRRFKVKQQLFQKGFEGEAIHAAMDELPDESD